MFRALLCRFALALVSLSPALAVAGPAFHLGIDVDNWSGQARDPRFEKRLRELGVDFLSWHLSPDEEKDPRRLNEIVSLCRKNNWGYLFNTEIVNYVQGQAQFRHPDGTYRYDLHAATLARLKDDPLFLGVIYDEAELMQAMLGIKDPKGNEIAPYFADTRKMTPEQAFVAVSAKVADLTKFYAGYGKRLIFEMVFPDNPFAMARGGALLAPKLLKENFNDLMYAVYRGAAMEYGASELWACVDLWFLDKFPFAGKGGPGFHTPEQLLDALQFSYSNGFDYVYIEQSKALVTETYELSAYGRKVVEFQRWRAAHKHGDWRTAPVEYYVKRFPDGYWGQSFSSFIPDHPYGSWAGNPYRKLDERWLQTLHELSHGSIPADANNWNAGRHPQFSSRPYQAMAGLPPMVVFDQFGTIPAHTNAHVLDFVPRRLGPKE